MAWATTPNTRNLISTIPGAQAHQAARHPPSTTRHITSNRQQALNTRKYQRRSLRCQWATSPTLQHRRSALVSSTHNYRDYQILFTDTTIQNSSHPDHMAQPTLQRLQANHHTLPQPAHGILQNKYPKTAHTVTIPTSRAGHPTSMYSFPS